MKMRKRKHLRYTRRALVESWFVTAWLVYYGKYEVYQGPCYL